MSHLRFEVRVTPQQGPGGDCGNLLVICKNVESRRRGPAEADLHDRTLGRIDCHVVFGSLVVDCCPWLTAWQWVERMFSHIEV